MRAIALVVLICCAAGNARAASDTVPHFAKVEPYAKARRTLSLLGWLPAHDDVTADRCPPGDPRCSAYPEVEACAGTGLANCLFVWIGPNKTKIGVSTVGQQDPIVVDVACRANCP